MLRFCPCSLVVLAYYLLSPHVKILVENSSVQLRAQGAVELPTLARSTLTNILLRKYISNEKTFFHSDGSVKTKENLKSLADISVAILYLFRSRLNASKCANTRQATRFYLLYLREVACLDSGQCNYPVSPLDGALCLSIIQSPRRLQESCSVQTQG